LLLSSRIELRVRYHQPGVPSEPGWRVVDLWPVTNRAPPPLKCEVRYPAYLAIRLGRAPPSERLLDRSRNEGRPRALLGLVHAVTQCIRSLFEPSHAT
jgi:hypothetical protein